MPTKVIIVESPSKAKTIGGYLGKDFKVLSSRGHVRDLKPGSMSVYPKEGWRAEYAVSDDKTQVVKQLRSACKDADEIVLATDLDREGEAIAWHILELLKIDANDDRYQRIVFNSITKSSLLSALESGRKVDLNLVNAQQARRFLDRVVGFEVSPLLWNKIGGRRQGLSAGRVQSVALRLVSEREQEILAFQPIESWKHSLLIANPELLENFGKEKTSGDSRNLPKITRKQLISERLAIAFEVRKYKGKLLKSTDSQTAAEHHARLLKALSTEGCQISAIEGRSSKSKPLPPFITSTLQQAGSGRGMAIDRVMRLAQNLYENGYITYMRTDSYWLNDDVVAQIRDEIASDHPDGAQALPPTSPKYVNKRGAQEAHEAIRPTNIDVKPALLKGRIADDAWQVYDMIWRRTMASQTVPATVERTVVTVDVNDYQAVAEGRVVLYQGCLHYWNVSNNLPYLPQFAEGQKLEWADLSRRQLFSSPPNRYTQATMVKEMEARGIGRPSTYVSTVKTLVDRNYVSLESNKMYLTDLGRNVCRRLQECFPELMAFEFTKGLEDDLDKVAMGDESFAEILDNFYSYFSTELNQAKELMKHLPAVEDESLGICQKCGGNMQLRYSVHGPYLICANVQPRSKSAKTSKKAEQEPEGCQSKAVNVDDMQQIMLALEKQAKENKTEEEPGAIVLDDPAASAPQNPRHCPVCNRPCVDKMVGDKRVFLCFNSPDCSGLSTEHLPNQVEPQTAASYPCEQEGCDGDLEGKLGRFGAYFTCLKCNKNVTASKSGEPEKPKIEPIPTNIPCTKYPDDTYLLREARNGSLFFAASKFPKNRETRTPLISELIPFKAQLPEPLQRFTEGPTQDPDGNDTLLRYDRKKAESYIGSTKNGKFTKWRCMWNSDTQKWS